MRLTFIVRSDALVNDELTPRDLYGPVQSERQKHWRVYVQDASDKVATFEFDCSLDEVAHAVRIMRNAGNVVQLFELAIVECTPEVEV